jgi:hypothetical protein
MTDDEKKTMSVMAGCISVLLIITISLVVFIILPGEGEVQCMRNKYSCFFAYMPFALIIGCCLFACTLCWHAIHNVRMAELIEDNQVILTSTNISDRTLYNDVKKIVISDDVLFIPDHNFEGCMHLEQVEIYGKTLSIGKNAFFGCQNLREVVIHTENQVAPPGDYAFDGCPLVKILVPYGKINGYKQKWSKYSQCIEALQ